MAVFDELNRGPGRLEDPEARQVEKIKRAGEAKSLKRKSSGVTLSTYKNSITAIYWIVGLAVVGGLVYLSAMAIGAFIGS